MAEQIIDIDKVLREVVLEWGKATKKSLQQRIMQMGLIEKYELHKSIRTRVLKNKGIVEGAALSFSRHGVFLEKGAGRGYGGTKGSGWINSQGTRVKANPLSKGKQGTGARPERIWYSAILDALSDQLADKVAEKLGDEFENTIKLKQ